MTDRPARRQAGAVPRLRALDEGNTRRRRMAGLGLTGAGLIWLVLHGLPAGAAENRGNPGFVPMTKATAAPAGFGGVCQRMEWVCRKGAPASPVDAAGLRLANRVNDKVNSSVVQISDLRQYGREEHWALPTARGGDCEDLALLKKHELLRAGIAPANLMLATVLDRRNGSHAVLVLRTAQGDMVLDSLRDGIRPWRATGYTFLRIQDPLRPGKWNAVMAGGVLG